MSYVMVDLLLRVVAVLAAATLLATAIRRSSASMRALAWTTGLVGALALPLIAAIAPSMEVGWLPSLTREQQTEPPAPPAPATLPVAPDARLARTGIAMDEVPEPATQFAVTSAAVERPDPPRPIVEFAAVLLVLWAIGGVLLLMRLLISHVRLSRLTAKATPAGGQWQASVAAVRSELGITRYVGVRTSRDVDVPAVAGVFRPVLLLPESSDWPAGARRDVTLHELAHVARWDALAQLASQAACAVYWFIPLVWYAARQAAALREQACDNVVLGCGTRPSAYADRLLSLSRTPMATQLEPVALAMARQSRIHGRVRGILDPSARRTRLSGSYTAAFMASILAAVAVVAVVEPVAASEPTAGNEPAAVMPSRNLVAAALDRLQPQSHPQSHPQSQSQSQPQSLPQSQPQSQPGALCSRGSEHTSINRHSDDGEAYWRLTAKGPDCDISVRVEGEPRFNDEFTDVVALGDGGTFEVDARIDGVRRELRLRETNGRITRVWRVDGRESDYDAAASAWFARFLIGLDRQTGFAVDVRLPKLLERGGVRAVLDETRQMSSDHVRSVYYTALSKARRMTPSELSSLLDQEAELNSSDFYAAELLKGVAKQGLGDPAVRRSVMRLITGMDSDFHKAETVKLLVESSELSVDQLGEVLSIVSGMSSDFHITEMLSTLVRSGTLDASKRRAYLNATREIDSDFHRAEALKALLGNGAPAAEEMPLLLSTVTAIDSDHHKGEVLGRLLDIKTLREPDLLRAQLAAQTIDSDFTESEILRRIAGHVAVTQAVKDAVYDAAGSLSSHYRDEVRRAVGR